MRRQPKTSAGGGGCGDGRSPTAHLRTAQRGQGLVPAQSAQRRLGQARALSGARARPARARARTGLRRECRGSRYGGGRCGEWERGDALMWSLIVSPEDAARMDLRRHVRDLVAGMERDLGTRLEWVAIDHHNTDNAHVHLLIRGVRDDGRDAHARSRLCEPRHPRTEPGTGRARAGAARLSRNICWRASGSSNANIGPKSTARWSGGPGLIGWSATRISRPSREGATGAGRAGNGAAGISRKARAGAPDR